MTQPTCPTDLSARPFQLTIERTMAAPPPVLFRAWTGRFDEWFASPGTMLTQTKVDTAYFFEVQHEEQRHPHYGRLLRLEHDRLVEFTWLSAGTKGIETVLTIELTPHGEGTDLRLTHAGFPDEESRKQHEEAWSSILEQLDQKIT